MSSAEIEKLAVCAVGENKVPERIAAWYAVLSFGPVPFGGKNRLFEKGIEAVPAPVWTTSGVLF